MPRLSWSLVYYLIPSFLATLGWTKGIQGNKGGREITMSFKSAQETDAYEPKCTESLGQAEHPKMGLPGSGLLGSDPEITATSLAECFS